MYTLLFDEAEARGEARGEVRGEARGITKGNTMGMDRLSNLINHLIAAGQMSEVPKVTSDSKYRDALLAKYEKEHPIVMAQ